MKNVAVIGAGTMGNGIAHTFAQNGFKVQLIDISEASLKKGINTITKNLERMVAKNIITLEKKKKLLIIFQYTQALKRVLNTRVLLSKPPLKIKH